MDLLVVARLLWVGMRVMDGVRSRNEMMQTERIARRSMQLPEREILGNRYELTAVIGRGQTAEVWAAHDRQLERMVAIKQPRADVPGEHVTSERLRREAIALAALDSPHIAPVFDVGIGDNGVFLVVKRLVGRTLADDVRRNGPMTPPRVCRIAGDILSGLAAIHASGLVHRDLKPTNVLVDREDRAILLDLGQALHPRAQPDPDEVTPAPREDSDLRVDLCQLALLMVFLLTGRTVQAPGSFDASVLPVPPSLRAVLVRALAPLAMRYPSTVQMAQALDQALAACMLEPFEPPAKRTRRWPDDDPTVE